MGSFLLCPKHSILERIHSIESYLSSSQHFEDSARAYRGARQAPKCWAEQGEECVGGVLEVMGPYPLHACLRPRLRGYGEVPDKDGVSPPTHWVCMLHCTLYLFINASSLYRIEDNFRGVKILWFSWFRKIIHKRRDFIWFTPIFRWNHRNFTHGNFPYTVYARIKLSTC